MALPKKGYLPGIYRFVSGTVDAAGDFSITNVPKEGYVPGIYQLTQVTIDANGDTDVAEDAVGIVAAVEVTVDAAGDLTPTDEPKEGFVPGLYKVTTSTNIPKEGFHPVDFSAVIGSVSGGIWEGGPVVQFNAALTNSLIPSVAVAATPTFTRASTDATVTDFEGLVKDVTADEARFVGARRVENLVVDSEDFTNAGWTKTSTTATADQLTATGANATTLDAYTAVAGDYVFSVELRRVTGTGNIQIAADSGTYTTVTLTGTYQRFSVQQTVVAGARNAGIRIVTSGDVVNARNAQLEFVEGQANQNPSEYVSIGAGDTHGANQDGVKYFATENGNTVASNVVTEATGSAIAAATLKGVLVEEARTNVLPDSEDFTTANWLIFGGATRTADNAIAPSGETTADLITDPGGGFSFIREIIDGILGDSEIWTVSIFVEKDAIPAATRFATLRLEMRLGTTLAGADLNFDTSTGATNTRVIAGGTIIDSGFEDYSTYRRFYVSVQNNATGNTRLQVEYYPAIGSGLLSSGYNGAITGSTNIWGAQLELGDFRGTYISTSGASATRNAETLSYPNTNILDAEGTLAFSFTPQTDTALYTGGGDRALIGVRGTNEDLIYIDSVSGETAVADGTGTTTVTAMPALVADTTVKLAARWSATSSLMDIGQDTTENQAAFDGSMNKSTAMRIGYSGANRGSGTYKLLRVYNGAVADATLTSLTT